MDSLYQSLLGLLGGGLSGWIVTQHQRRLDKRDEDERKARETELAAARERQWQEMKQNVQSLKDRIEQHIKEDKTQVVLTKLTAIDGNIQKVLDQQQALLVADGEQKQQIITLFNNLKEQKEELKECQKEHKK